MMDLLTHFFIYYNGKIIFPLVVFTMNGEINKLDKNNILTDKRFYLPITDHSPNDIDKKESFYPAINNHNRENLCFSITKDGDLIFSFINDYKHNGDNFVTNRRMYLNTNFVKCYYSDLQSFLYSVIDIVEDYKEIPLYIEKHTGLDASFIGTYDFEEVVEYLKDPENTKKPELEFGVSQFGIKEIK